MKKIFGILLLVCMVVPVGATYIYLRMQRKAVRREIKHSIMAGLHHEDLVLLKFTEAQKTEKLAWKHSKEFCFETQMYDIVQTEQHGDTTYYYCWWDHQETKLNKQLDELINFAWRRSSQRRDSQKRVISFYKSLFFNASQSEEVFAFFKKTPTPHAEFLELKGYYSPPFHPPNLA